MLVLIIAININLYSNEITNKEIAIYQKEINSLSLELIEKDIPSDWLFKNINNPKFKLYHNIDKYFYKMAENRVLRKEKDFEWYKVHMGLDIKIKNAKAFMQKYIQTLEGAEKKHGIHLELITAILGIETSYAVDNKNLGNFIIFSTLVSQYIFMPKRRNWAARELASLYEFSNKINKSVYYFIGSFAGACGWAQFIPTSLLKYFIDTQDNNSNIDIYAVDDAIMSIENYLYNQGLSDENINLLKSRYQAIYKYNPSDAYVKAVLYIYDALIKNHKN